MSVLKSLGSSKEWSSTVFCSSLRSPEHWSYDALCITTAVAKYLEAISMTLREACRDAFTIT